MLPGVSSTHHRLTCEAPREGAAYAVNFAPGASKRGASSRLMISMTTRYVNTCRQSISIDQFSYRVLR